MDVGLTSDDRNRYVGAISPAYAVQLSDENGYLNLTNCTPFSFTLTLQNASNPAQVIVGTGAWTVVDALKGRASYQWSVADLSNAGAFHAYTSVKLPSEAGFRVFEDLVIINVLPLGAIPFMQDVNLAQINGMAISTSNAVPTTQADGANVAIGATSDSAYSGSGAASLVAVLKAIYAQLAALQNQKTPLALHTPPAQTNAGAKTTLNFGASGTSAASLIIINNKSGSNLYYSLDPNTDASPGTVLVPDGGYHAVPIQGLLQVTLYTASAVNLNGITSPNIHVEAWQ